MSATSDSFKKILTLGLGAYLLDGPLASPEPVGTNNDTGLPKTVEQTSEEPQLQDREPFMLNGVNGKQTLLLGGAAILGIIGVILVARNI